MKRTVIVAAGVMALGVAIYVGQLWAQTGTRPATAPAAEPKTRIAVFNLSYVVKNYEKFKTFQEEMKRTVEPYQAKDNSYKTEGQKLATEVNQPNTTPERREQIDKRMVELKRLIDDNKTAANKVLVKKNEEQMRILYMDTRNVVEKVAQSRGFEMVLHFNDATTQQDYWSAANIGRKMQAGALMPMYYANALDISSDIVTTLNASYKATAHPATPPPAR